MIPQTRKSSTRKVISQYFSPLHLRLSTVALLSFRHPQETRRCCRRLGGTAEHSPRLGNKPTRLRKLRHEQEDEK
jgi:hypothetical protein